MPQLSAVTPLPADFTERRNWVSTIPITVDLTEDFLLLSDGVSKLLLSDGLSFMLLGSSSGGALGAQNFDIYLAGNFQVSDKNIIWRYILVDNIENENTFIISFNSYLLIVPAFSRQTFPIPLSTARISLIGVQQSLNVILSSDQPIAPDLDNQFAIALAAKVRLPITIVGASQNQDATATGEQMVFDSPAAIISYNLLDPTLVDNGYFQFLQNISNVSITQNAFYIEIKPPVGQTINDVFTNAAPMRLYPGDSGKLVSDGVEWFFEGSLSYQSNVVALPAAGVSLVIVNPCGRKFDEYVLSLRNVTAELNYAIGDEIVIGTGAQLNAAGASSIMGLIIASGNNGTTVTLRMSSVMPFAIPNKTSGVPSNITAANWNIVFRGRVRW